MCVCGGGKVRAVGRANPCLSSSSSHHTHMLSALLCIRTHTYTHTLKLAHMHTCTHAHIHTQTHTHTTHISSIFHIQTLSHTHPLSFFSSPSPLPHPHEHTRIHTRIYTHTRTGATHMIARGRARRRRSSVVRWPLQWGRSSTTSRRAWSRTAAPTAAALRTHTHTRAAADREAKSETSS